MTNPDPAPQPSGAVALSAADLASLLAAYGIVTEQDSGIPGGVAPTTPSAPQPVHVRAERGGLLEQLYDQFTDLKPQLDKLAAQVDEIKDAIKSEVRQRAPQAEEFYITRSDGVGRPIKVSRRVTEKFDTKAFERANGDTYRAWKRSIESWTLGWS
jgi:hypothetical protein